MEQPSRTSGQVGHGEIISNCGFYKAVTGGGAGALEFECFVNKIQTCISFNGVVAILQRFA